MMMFHFKKNKRIYFEQDQQIKFFDYLRWKHKKYISVCFSIPNEGNRTYAGLSRLIRAGLTAGIPDVFCAIPSKNKHGLFIEFKYGSNTLTDNQEKIIGFLVKNGFQCSVCYSADEAIKVFDDYISNT